MAVEDLRCPDCSAVLETEDIYWAHLKIHHPMTYARLEGERIAERKRRAKERMREIMPTLNDIAETFGVSKYLANILYNTLRGRRRKWEDFKQVELKGVKHIMEQLIVPPHTAYYFYYIATRSTGDYQNVDWGAIGEKDWKDRYASDEYKGLILESLQRYGITEMPVEDEEAVAIEMESEEFAKAQINQLLKEVYELGLDDERVQALTESEDILIELAKEGINRAKVALGDYTKVPLQKFLRPHELEQQPTRATKVDIAWVRGAIKGIDTDLLRDALVRGRFMGRVIFKPLREVIAEEIESRRPEEMAEAMMEEPYAFTQHLFELIKHDESLTHEEIGRRREDLELRRHTLKQLIDGLIWRRDTMEDIVEDLSKLGATQDDISAIRNYVESKWAVEGEEARPPAEAHPGVVRETVRAFREQLSKLEESIIKRVDERLGAIEEKITKTPKRLPPPIEIEPKEIPAPIFAILPKEERYIDTTPFAYLCSICVSEECQRLAEELYGEDFARLRGEKRKKVIEEAEIAMWAEPTAIIMRNPELEVALQQVRDPRRWQYFPKEPALYELCDRHFQQCGYGWDNTVRQKIYEFVKVRHELSIPNFTAVGIPAEWIKEQIELAEIERLTREIPR